jgi:hypothetical protein
MEKYLKDIPRCSKIIGEYQVINYEIEPFVVIKAKILESLNDNTYSLDISHRIALPGANSFYNKTYSSNTLEGIYQELRYFFLLAVDSKMAEEIDKD